MLVPEVWAVVVDVLDAVLEHRDFGRLLQISPRSVHSVLGRPEFFTALSNPAPAARRTRDGNERCGRR